MGRSRPDHAARYPPGMGLFDRILGRGKKRDDRTAAEARLDLLAGRDRAATAGERERLRNRPRSTAEERLNRFAEADRAERPRLLSEAEAWALAGGWQPVSSSNVVAILYEADDERLLIEYGKAGKPSSFYAYQPVPLAMAMSLYDAPSKGTWVWDNLRLRGTVFGYKVPYVFLSGPSAARRKWHRTQESRARHGRIGPSGRNDAGEVIQPEDVW